MQMKSCQPEITITLNLQEMQRVILLDLAQGYDGSFATTNVVRGELLESYQQADEAFNYRLCSDPDRLLFCEADDVAPLQEEQFHLLEAITNPLDRLEVFRHTLEWGMSLKDGANVCVTLPNNGASPPTYAKAIVRYRGPLRKQYGTFFGVEIMVCSYSEYYRCCCVTSLVKLLY